ncbi:MAG: hypothetical protein H5T49_04050 [Hadesarchaea archaeon]|nr:hypothetical protein [Hadesarchaea archaeon]
METISLSVIYVGLRDGRLVGCTDANELEKAEAVVVGKYKAASYCPKHNHIVVFCRGSDFHVDNAKKARDCEEFIFFEKCWNTHRNFAKALLKNDSGSIEKAIKRFCKRHLIKLLADKDFLRQLLERLDKASRSELEWRLVGTKLES